MSFFPKVYGFTVVLERDHDGEAQATIPDTTAAYIKS